MWSAGEWARAPGRWGCWGVIDVVDERGWVLTEDAGSATAMTRRVEADADEDDIPAFGTNSAGERLVVLDVLSDEGTVIVLGGWYTPREPGSGARDMETQEFRLELMRIRLSDGTITGGLALGTHTLIVNDFLGRFLSWVDADAVMALVNESLFHAALAVVVDLGTMTARLDTAGLTEASGGSPFFTRLRGRAVGYGDEPPEGRSLGEFSRCLDARDGTRIEAEPGWMILGLFDDWMFTCPRPQQRASDPAAGLRSTNLRTRETIDVGHAIAPLWLACATRTVSSSPSARRTPVESPMRCSGPARDRRSRCLTGPSTRRFTAVRCGQCSAVGHRSRIRTSSAGTRTRARRWGGLASRAGPGSSV